MSVPGARVRLRGTVISPGVAVGVASIVEPLAFPSTPATIAAQDVEREIERLHYGKQLVREHLEEHVRGVHAPAAEDWPQIFAAHLLVLEDHAFFRSIEDRIRHQLLPADRAVEEAFHSAASRLAASDDCYMRARAEDLRDIVQSQDKQITMIPAADHNDVVFVGLNDYFKAIRAFVDRTGIAAK